VVCQGNGGSGWLLQHRNSGPVTDCNPPDEPDAVNTEGGDGAGGDSGPTEARRRTRRPNRRVIGPE